MAACTAQAQIGTGSSVSWASAEGGIVFNRADHATSTTAPVPIPTATGTKYSWLKNLVLSVTVGGTTAITNRNISYSGSLTTGLTLHWKQVAVASYAQAASGNMPADSGSNDAVPSGYTQMTGTAALLDNTSVATSSTGPNGDMGVVVLGVSYLYVGDPGTAIALPSIILRYDEA